MSLPIEYARRSPCRPWILLVLSIDKITCFSFGSLIAMARDTSDAQIIAGALYFRHAYTRSGNHLFEEYKATIHISDATSTPTRFLSLEMFDSGDAL